ncbi:MAG TPA: DUF4349 domain-containing protein [Gaiellaceae bacterium]|nr:DUF4349 domain-containing protein [Gaiellaceae bacterium]
MSALDGMGAERLEALLRGEEPRTQAEERRAALLTELRGGALNAPESLRRRVLAAAPAARRSYGFRRPPRRLVLVVVPLALAGAVSAAIVHGIVGSGSPAPTSMAGNLARQAPGVFGLQSLKQPAHGSASKRETIPSAANDATAAAPERELAPLVSGRLVHEDATLAVRVQDNSALTSATSQATKIVGALGGWAQSVHYETAHDGSGSAYLDLRVPVGNVKKAVAQLGALGSLQNENISTKDLEQTVTRQSNRIASLRRTIAAYEKALQDPTLPEAQRVILQVRLANAKRSLTQLRHARTGTISSGETANVSLTLTTKQAAAAVPHKRGRLGRMLHGAVGFLGLEGIVVLYALVVLSPILVVGGLAWAVLRERRRREEQRLLAA